jgi:hypothetical protein
MESDPATASNRGFRYFVPDPVTAGTWQITSHRKLAASEIEKQLRFVVAWGVERPDKDRVAKLTWPEAL